LKTILGVVVAAFVLGACSHEPSSVCSENAGYCRHETDGGCEFRRPLCCSGSAPQCGNDATLVPMDSTGCTVVDGFTLGLGCA
jgi:hypothetical protein